MSESTTSSQSAAQTDSDASLLPANDDSISRRSGLFSAQKFASAASLSKIGTSSQLAIARILQLPLHCDKV